MNYNDDDDEICTVITNSQTTHADTVLHTFIAGYVELTKELDACKLQIGNISQRRASILTRIHTYLSTELDKVIEADALNGMDLFIYHRLLSIYDIQLSSTDPYLLSSVAAAKSQLLKCQSIIIEKYG